MKIPLPSFQLHSRCKLVKMDLLGSFTEKPARNKKPTDFIVAFRRTD